VFGSAAPRPVLGAVDQAGADGIRQHVLDRRLEVIFVMDHPRGEALGQEGASPPVTGVVFARVMAVEPVEGAGELARRSLDDDVVVRSHDAVGMKRQAGPSHSSSEVDHEEQPIAVVAEEHRLPDRLSRDVEEAGRQVAAADSSHGFDATREPAPATPVVPLPSPIRHGFASRDECQTLVAARTA
jgi:hypothetical protein